VEVWELVLAKPRNFINNSQVKIENPRKAGFGKSLDYKMTVKFCKLTHKKYPDEVVYGLYLGYDPYTLAYSVVKNGKCFSEPFLTVYWDIDVLQICSIDFTQWGMIENELFI